MQLHLEASAGVVASWCAEPGYAEGIEPSDSRDMVRRLADSEEQILGAGRTMFERWLRIKAT